MSELNVDKNLRGQSSKEALKSVLVLAKKLGYIKNLTLNYKIGKPGYSDKNQFKAPYLIEFSDETKWILFTTTSIRDRVKEQYWEALNIKEIDPLIKAAYLVYPDSISEKERKTAEAKNRKIQTNAEFATLEGIVSQDTISNMIEAYALRNKSKGQKLDAKGNNFESRVASTLSNSQNLKKWQTESDTIEGVHFEMFLRILDCFGLNKKSVSKIDASCDKKIIGLLPSGGPAKTDVLVTVYSDKGKECFSISCKRSSLNSVSVHQYDADTFANVLDADNEELRVLLNLFQEKGNRRDMGEENSKRLAEVIKPYNKALSLWALGGIGGAGNPEKQWANYILTYNNNDGSVSIHTLNDYYDLLISNGTKGMFGTLFGWTYQGKRGTNIQLKVTVK